MSIRRMSLGEGYRYLLSSVARGDGAAYSASSLTRYYAESGTPPGWFLGAGLAGLADGSGVQAGSVVSEEHLFRMLGMLQDPASGQPLGRLPSAVSTCVDGSTRRPVAGFDLTFSVPKSVSVMWALADPATQRQIYEAHVAALRFTIAHAEQGVFATRSGKGGVLQEEVRGVVAAAFDHWDSRAGDPQLHTHVAVLNRAQTGDGTWKTLDSRALFKSAVTLSALYNGVLSDYLTAALGVAWEPTERGAGKRHQWEIGGVPAGLREEFSQRTASIDAATRTLADRAADGRNGVLSERDRLRLRQQATLITRPDKQQHSLAELTASWRDRARRFIGDDPAGWAASLRDRNPLPLLRANGLDDGMLRDTARLVARVVGENRATFSRANVLAETLRQLHGVRFASPDDRVHVAQRVTDFALEAAVLITPPELAHTPEQFRRLDGSSRFRPVGSELYTSRDLLEAEARLLDAARNMNGPAIPARAADHAAMAGSLTVEQRAAVAVIISSGRELDVLVGAAGTGKTTAMGALRETWENTCGEGSVIGLAPSAAAADVLATELGIPTENTAKWLTELARQPERITRLDELNAKQARRRDLVGRLQIQRHIDQLTTDIDRWSLRTNQLLILDEASLAATRDLDILAAHAVDAGAKILLVGDPAQLSAVGAGGAFAMLVRDRPDSPELTTVQRFTQPWERDASLRLRAGDTSVIADYLERGRISDGDRDDMVEALYQAWRVDTVSGVDSLMIAADNDTVHELNTRAQEALTHAGQVSTQRIRAADGYTVGVGDHVITRRNDRTLNFRGGWIKNGDDWTITKLHRDSSCTVTSLDRSSSVRLPAPYVGEHLELGYATNAYRAQGRTVDSAHAFVSATTQRELLYVMATRGRSSNRLYVNTAHDPDLETRHGPVEQRSSADVLSAVLGNEGNDRSATETIRSEWNEQYSIARIWSEYETIAAAARADRYHAMLAASGLTGAQMEEVAQSESHGALLSAMRDAEARNLNLDEPLAAVIASRPFDNVEDIASVLHHRIELWATTTKRNRGADEARIVGLFPRSGGVRSADIQQGLDDRAELIEQRALALATVAVENQQPWAIRLGGPPEQPEAREEWLAKLTVIAAYRDRWQVHDRTVLGPMGNSAEQLEHRKVAEHAAAQALAMNTDVTAWEQTRVWAAEPEIRSRIVR